MQDNSNQIVSWRENYGARFDDMVAPFYCPLCNRGVDYRDAVCWYCGAQNARLVKEKEGKV